MVEEVATSRVSYKHNASWILGSNLLYGVSQWGILIVLARLGSTHIVGEFALGLAIVAPVDMFGRLQLRTILASDASSQFSVGVYLGLRFLMASVTWIVVVSFAVVSGYDTSVIAVVIGVAFAKGFESVSDMLYGFFQLRDAMDTVGKSMIIRSALSLLGVAAGTMILHSAAAAAAGLAFVWGVLLIGYDLPMAARVASDSGSWVEALRNFRPEWNWQLIRSLLFMTAPLGVVAALGSLRINVPRYLVVGDLGEGALGVFAALTYLITVGGRVVFSLMQVSLPRMGRFHSVGEAARFRRTVLVQAGIALGVGIAGVAVALVFGSALLAVVYGRQYGGFGGLLVWVMAVAVFEYVAMVLQLSLTASRSIRIQIPIRILAVGTAGVVGLISIPTFGLVGATWALGAGSLIEVIGAAVFIWCPNGIRPACR